MPVGVGYDLKTWMRYEDFIENFNCVHVCRIFPADWHQLVLKGAWAGAAAGGPPNLSDGRASGTWGNNPQYRITAQGDCEVLLSLLQRDARVANGEEATKVGGGGGGDDETGLGVGGCVGGEREVGMVVLRCGRDQRDRKWKVEPTDVIRLATPSSDRETTMSLRLEAGKSYVIVPFTARAGQEAPFVLRSFSSAPVEVERLLQPFELACEGKWDMHTAGGNKTSGTFGSNPQYMITTERQTAAMISVKRLDVDPEDTAADAPPAGRGFELGITLLKPLGGAAAVAAAAASSNGGSGGGGGAGAGGAGGGDGLPPRILTVPSSSQNVEGEGDFTSTREALFFTTLTPEHPHILVPSAVQPGAVVAPYSVTVYSAHEIQMVEYPESQAAVLSGQWSKEGGGCNLNPTWSSNPKFLLAIADSGTFKVTLSVDGGQWKRGKSLDKMIGFCVFPSDRADGKITPDRKAVLHETSYVPMKEVSVDLQLSAAEPTNTRWYVVMPTLYAPNIPGKFTLSVTSETKFQFTAIS